jgi:hypothetical protein
MQITIVEVVKPCNEITMDKLIESISYSFIGVVSNISANARYFWNPYHRSFVNIDGALNPPFESLRKALTDNNAIKEVHRFETAKELYQWLAEEN